jgi:hypothetical protein
MRGLHHGEQAVQPDWEHTKKPRSSYWTDVDQLQVHRCTGQLRLHEDAKFLFD